MIPFARTAEERRANNDPRPSLQERYGSHDGYVAAVKKAAERAVAESFLLPEDAAALVTVRTRVRCCAEQGMKRRECARNCAE